MSSTNLPVLADPAASMAGREEGPPRARRLAAAFLLSVTGNTRTAYASDLEAWFGFCARWELDPLSARRMHVDGFAEHLRRENAAGRTVNRRLATLAKYYEYCLDDADDTGIPLGLTSDPVRKVKRVKGTHTSDTRALSREETAAMLMAAAQPWDEATRTYQRDPVRDLAIIAVYLATAARVSELANASLSDIGHTATGHNVVWVVRKGGDRQALALPPQAWVALGRYLIARGCAVEGQQGWQLLPSVGGEPLWGSASGARLNRNQIAKMIVRCARRAGIGHVHPHVLRKTAAVEAHRQGVQLQIIQAWLGHASSDTTLLYLEGLDDLEKSPAYGVANGLIPAELLVA